MFFPTQLHFTAKIQAGIGLGIPKKQNIESVIDHNFYILTLFCPECVDIRQGHHNIPNNLLLITSIFLPLTHLNIISFYSALSDYFLFVPTNSM